VKLFPVLFLSVLMVPAIAPFSSAIAGSVREISITLAQKGVSLKVTPEGSSIDLGAESGGQITITDRRQILVKRIGNSIYLQRIKFQQIDGMIGAGSGISVLRVWTPSGKRLIFNLSLGNSGSTDLSIVPTLQAYSAPPRPFRAAIVAPLAKSEETSSYPLVKSISLDKPFPLVSSEDPSTREETSFDLQKDRKVKTEEQIIKSKPQHARSWSQKRRAKKILKEERQDEVIDPTPIVSPSKNISLSNVPKFRDYKPTINQAQAKSLNYGLNVARLSKGKNHIAFHSLRWHKVQVVIAHLRRGVDLSDAILKAKADKTLILRLLKDGGFLE
jgi:hypothetical protein